MVMSIRPAEARSGRPRATPEAISALRAQAREGRPHAMTELGQRLLVGRDLDQDVDEGVELIRRAAEAGDAEAVCQMASLLAMGAWMPRDWAAGLDHLQLAAERGSPRARGQLEVLAGDRSLAAEMRRSGGGAEDGWGRLRRSIDVNLWSTPPEGRRVLCDAPRIRACDAFAPVEVCDWLIDRARGKFVPAMLFDGISAHFHADRTNSDFAFDVVSGDVVLTLVRERIANMTRLPTPTMEPPQIFHYAVGQEIKGHYDFLKPGDGSAYGGGYEGERIATFLIYLNDDYEGGELDFPHIGLKHRGRTGDAVFFANVDAAGKPDRSSLHAARPILGGEKFIFSQWIHDRPFTAVHQG
jgi:hypothetical protein